MRAALALPLLASLALAGCATTVSPVQDAEAGHAGLRCPVGSVVTGFDADGAPRCDGFLVLGDAMCPKGSVVAGFRDGAPACRSLAEVSGPAPKQATQSVSSNLKVVGIYGVRNSTSVNLWDVKVHVELSAGATPMDLRQMVVRYSDGATTRNYGHSASAPASDGAPGAATFKPTWIRGSGADGAMESGDLVQLHFNLVSGTLAPRTDVNVDLIPEMGSPVAADFRTPATYSTDTVIALR